MAPWAAYLPVPFVRLVLGRLQPDNRATRYHIVQGRIAFYGGLGLLLGVGFLGMASEAAGYRAFIGALALVPLGWLLVALPWGAVAAARGRFVRLRPAWDLAHWLEKARKDGPPG